MNERTLFMPCLAPLYLYLRLGPHEVWEYSNCGSIWWTEESSLAYPGSHSSSEKRLAFLTLAFSTTHAFLATGRSYLGALLSTLEQMWIGKGHKKEKKLGSREVI